MATILLVEDDTSMRLLTTAKLKHRYAIISVQDGVEALDVLERHPVDLIIADVMMPRMDGYTLVKTLRERGVKARQQKGQVDRIAAAYILQHYLDAQGRF